MSKTKFILACTSALLGFALVPSSYATVALTCNSTITSTGGNSAAGATNVGGVCNATTISVTGGSIPTYWEFTWVGVTQSDDIVADVSGDHPAATLLLDNSGGNNIASDGFTDHVILDFSDATISDVTLTRGTQYIVGISAPQVDPNITVNFNPSVVAATPEPATLSLLGTGMALLPVIRRRLRAN